MPLVISVSIPKIEEYQAFLREVMMRDEQKTKEQLLQELKVLRTRLEQFEQAEHKKTDPGLKKSEWIFQTIFNKAADGILLADVETKKFYMGNNVISQMLGYDSQELTNLSVMDIHPDQELPYVIEQFDQQARGEHTLARDLPVKRKNGSVFFADVNAFPIQLDGKIYLMGIFRDISEYKQAEKELRDSKNLLEKVFSSLNSAVFVLDNKIPPCIIDCNPAAISIFGYQKNQLVGQTTDILHVNAESLLKFQKTLFPAIESQGHISHFEFRMKRKDGRIFPSEHSIRPMKNDKGDRIGWVSIVSDITERKKAENTLRESEEKFRLAMDATNDALWDWNMVTNEVYRNPRHATMLGYEPDELTESQDEWEKRVHPDDRQFLSQILNEHYAGKRDSIEVEYRLRTKSGDYKWILGRGKIVAYNNDGSPARMIGTNIDITERKKAEQAESEYQTLIRGIMDNTGSIVVVRDLQGYYLMVNKEVEKVLGMESEQIVGKTPYDIYPYDKADKILSDDKRVIESRNILKIEDLLDVKGEIRTFEGTRFPLINPDGDAYAVCTIAMDITERRKQYERYEIILKTCIDGFWVIDSQGKILEVNDAYCQMSGYSRDELLTMYVKDVEAKEKPEETIEHIRSIKDKGSHRFESSHRRKDGTIMDLDISVNYLPLDGGRTFTFFRDISDAKRTEKEIRKFKTIADKAGYGVGIADLQRNLIYVNNSYAQMHQYSINELIGKKIPVLHTEEQMEYANLLLNQIEQKGGFVAEEVWHKRRDGTVFPTLMSATLIKTESGEPLFLAATAIDITKHKKAEEALQKSELRYRTLFETLPVGVGLTSPDGRITDANSAMMRMVDLPIKDIKHLNVRDLYKNPKDRIQLLKQLQQDGLVRDFETEFKRKDGSTYFVNINVTAMKTNHDIELVSVVTDTTEQRQMKKTLAESEEKYRTLVESARDPIATIDKNGTYLFMNKTAANRLTGREENLAGKTLWDFFPKEIADRHAKNIRRVIETKQGANFVSLTTIQNQTRWYNTTIEPLRDDSGNVTAAIIIARDVDDIKRAQEQIHKLSSAVESSINGIAIGDSEGNLTYANPALLEMWRYGDHKEVLGKNGVELWQIPEQGQQILDTVLNKGSWIGEMTAQRKDGSTFDAQICATLLKDEKGKPISMMASFVDISETKRKEQELNRYRGQMARAEQLASLGTLSATVAHQLTQPLTVIRLSMDNALDELEASSSSDTVIRRLKDSLTQISNITSIIDRFRNFARKSSGKTVAEVNIKVVTVRIAELLSESARRANIILRLKKLDDLPCPWINENDLEQLFFALIENAIQAADGKKTRQLVISGATKKKNIELSITDNCGGIAPENMNKIFEPFFTTKPRGQGTGLGLCIVQDVVSRNGGRIEIESKFGRGTTFTVCLPIEHSKIS